MLRGMLPTTVECAQCGRDATSDSDLGRWRHGELALDGEVREVGEGLLLCPDCDADSRDRAFEEGEGG